MIITIPISSVEEGISPNCIEDAKIPSIGVNREPKPTIPAGKFFKAYSQSNQARALPGTTL